MRENPNKVRSQLMNSQHEQAKEQQAHGAGMQTGHQEVGSPTIDLHNMRDSNLIGELFSPEIERENPDHYDGVAGDLEEKFSAEFGRHLGLANLSESRWNEEYHMDRARAACAKMEYRHEGSTGSKCTGKVREIMTSGGQSSRPLLTDDISRQIDATFEERTNLRSLSINARGFRGITEAIVYSITDGYDSEASDNGGDGFISSTIGRVIP